MPSLRESFQMPKPVKITGRTSTITNSFVNSIIPVVYPTDAEIENALDLLGMTKDSVGCAYCGDTSTEWDHLNPLVDKQKPTGYISEIANLVPACGKCNQSKGNKAWRVWIVSAARLSPKSRGVSDLETRIQMLERYEENNHPERYDFEEIVGSEKWTEYWEDWARLLGVMRESQQLAEDIRRTIHDAAAGR